MGSAPSTSAIYIQNMFRSECSFEQSCHSLSFNFWVFFFFFFCVSFFFSFFITYLQILADLNTWVLPLQLQQYAYQKCLDQNVHLSSLVIAFLSTFFFFFFPWGGGGGGGGGFEV